MKELLEYIAKKILPHPDDFTIEESVDEEGNVRLLLVTHPEDTGLAIGKEGRTARSLRELLKIKAVQEGVRVYLDIKSPQDIEDEKKKTAPEEKSKPEEVEQETTEPVTDEEPQSQPTE